MGRKPEPPPFFCATETAMDEFAWEERYSINDDAIDQEHRHLFALANQVLCFRASGERLEAVRGAMVALYEYVKTHFAHEEQYMQEVGYPGLPAHRVLHETIIHEMNEIMRESPQLDTLVYKLKRLMKTWVVHHILEADRQIGDFLRQRTGQPFSGGESGGGAVPPPT